MRNGVRRSHPVPEVLTAGVRAADRYSVAYEEYEMVRRQLALLLAVILLIVVGCGSSSTDESGSLAMSADPLPAPTGEVVLTIRGAAQPNVGDEVQLDLAGIESLGTTTVTLFEPFVNRELEVTGVRVDQLLAAAGVDPDDELTWSALDDYQVHFTRGEVRAEDAILATRLDGSLIDVVDGGPVRVMFTDPEGTLGRDTNQWIWSLYLIEVV